jgi:hypothetical protein
VKICDVTDYICIICFSRSEVRSDFFPSWTILRVVASGSDAVQTGIMCYSKRESAASIFRI